MVTSRPAYGRSALIRASFFVREAAVRRAARRACARFAATRSFRREISVAAFVAACRPPSVGSRRRDAAARPGGAGRAIRRSRRRDAWRSGRWRGAAFDLGGGAVRFPRSGRPAALRVCICSISSRRIADLACGAPRRSTLVAQSERVGGALVALGERAAQRIGFVSHLAEAVACVAAQAQSCAGRRRRPRSRRQQRGGAEDRDFDQGVAHRQAASARQRGTYCSRARSVIATRSLAAVPEVIGGDAGRDHDRGDDQAGELQRTCGACRRIEANANRT